MSPNSMLQWLPICPLVLFLAGSLPCARGEEANVPPEGFTALFNGRDLDGWFGLGHFDPRQWSSLSDQDRREMREKHLADRQRHWRVEDGQIINDGKGPYLTADREFGDMELWIDFKISPKADSGIYLRGTPQVQIWDTTEEAGYWPLGADKGSGSLWNNKKAANRALVHADRPVGEWNRFRIRMVGPYTTVYLNDQLVVDNVPLENYWDPEAPLPARGLIQLQTHGGEIRFRNIFLREIPDIEANALLQSMGDEGFVPILNQSDMHGWIGDTAEYTVRDGMLECKEGSGGHIYTDKSYKDFAVRFEFRLPPGGNNGLAIRAPLEGDPAYTGVEVQILDDASDKYPGLKSWQYHGSLYGLAPARRGYLRPVGEWNFQEVIARGPRVTVNLNGTMINDANLDEARPIDGKDHPGRLRREGHLGFMGHGDAVQVRNICVKEL